MDQAHEQAVLRVSGEAVSVEGRRVHEEGDVDEAASDGDHAAHVGLFLGVRGCCCDQHEGKRVPRGLEQAVAVQEGEQRHGQEVEGGGEEAEEAEADCLDEREDVFAEEGTENGTHCRPNGGKDPDDGEEHDNVDKVQQAEEAVDDAALGVELPDELLHAEQLFTRYRSAASDDLLCLLERPTRARTQPLAALGCQLTEPEGLVETGWVRGHHMHSSSLGRWGRPEQRDE
mmetsp:Transcript_21708/g.50374  ORF Transcript_21708/g.50374 Transcript_21708/m.50374 type:complete len:230 (+) Transcript_21708:679-1368(+)